MIVNIGIADDHEIIRNGLQMILEQHRMQVTLSVSSFHALMESLETAPIDLLILDLNLGDDHGIESIGTILEKYPKLPILVLSAYPEDLYAIRTFKAGAMGYLNKGAVTEEILHAIEKIGKGEHYISKQLQESLPLGFSLKKEEKELTQILSKREFEVLRLLGEGLSFQEIAQKLSLSPKTVSTYRTRMLEKLHLESTAQLLQFAYNLHHTTMGQEE